MFHLCGLLLPSAAPGTPVSEVFWGSALIDILISRGSVFRFLYAAVSTHFPFSKSLLTSLDGYCLFLFLSCGYVPCFKSLLSLGWDPRREVYITFNHKFLSIAFEIVFQFFLLEVLSSLRY